jgi:hypothetical protein
MGPKQNILPSSKGTKKDRVKQATFRYKKKLFPRAKTIATGTVSNVSSTAGSPTNNETVNIVNTPSTPSAVTNPQALERLPALDKIQPIVSETPKEKDKVSGYRMMDMHVLANVFSAVLCPDCQNPSLSLTDRLSCKKGMASLLILQCNRFSCDFKKEFYTSNCCDKSFDVNKRMVYTMRALGNGHAGIEKFTHLMDMPNPMTKKNYEKIADKIGEVAKEVAEQSMKDAAEDLRDGKESDEIVDIGVS